MSLALCKSLPSHESLALCKYFNSSNFPCSRLSLSSRQVSHCSRPSLFPLTDVSYSFTALSVLPPTESLSLRSPKSSVFTFADPLSISRETRLYKLSFLTPASRRNPHELGPIFSLRRHFSALDLSLVATSPTSLSHACSSVHQPSHHVPLIFHVLLHM